MMKHLKRSISFLTILVLVVLSFFTISMIGNFSPEAHATQHDDLLDICLITNTYLSKDMVEVDWNGFWVCVGTALST